MKKSKQKININDFSKHLFWDVNRNNLDLERSKKTIITNVLDYGLINDWNMIYSYYGIDEIAKVVMNIRYLDKKSIAFVSLLSKIPKENFLCYTTRQLNQTHWEF